MQPFVTVTVVFLLTAAACSGSEKPSVDAGGGQTGTHDAATNPSPDAASSGIQAMANRRCALPNRLGIIELSGADVGNGTQHYVTSFVYTSKDPRLGNVVEQNDVCRHHRLTVVPGAYMPERPRDVKLIVLAGDQRQELTPVAPTWDPSGEISLPGDTFGLELRWGALTVTVPAMQVPPPLRNVTERLTGSLEEPDVLTVTWTKPAQDTHVYSLIPVNHHAGGPTFTECLTPAATGSFVVGKSMLTPLAVSTGLEFQGVRHLRYAAAETPKGCIEFHYFSSHPPNLML